MSTDRKGGEGPKGKALGEGDLDDLLRVAHATVLLAHAPYSGVCVGAALLDEHGRVWNGCNVENASYGLTMCAERVALVKAVVGGAGRIRTLALASSVERPLMPCGACRQVLQELAPDAEVVVEGRSGPRVRAWVEELLPQPFVPGDLEPPTTR